MDVISVESGAERSYAYRRRSACADRSEFSCHSRIDDEKSTMSPIQRFVLSEEPPNQLPPALLKSIRRREKHLRRHCDAASLHELDETVASVGKLYQTYRRNNDDDSLGSHSIATADGQTIYTHRDLLHNMPDFKSSVVSSRSVRSSSRRRRRGSSLERMIGKTIRQEARKQESKYLEYSPENSVSEHTSVNYILKDLVEASIVLETETGTVSLQTQDNPTPDERRRKAPKTSPAEKFNPLLPPIASESYTSQDEDLLQMPKFPELDPPTPKISEDSDEDDSPFVKINDLNFLTPNTSNETSADSMDAVEGFSNAFDNIQGDAWQPYDQALWPEASLPVKGDFGDEWILAPFDGDSLGSPYSVADFSHVRSWKTSETGWKAKVTI